MRWGSETAHRELIGDRTQNLTNGPDRNSTNRPRKVFGRCCKLVGDQFPIRCGSASRPHRFPRLYAITLSHNRTSFDQNR